MTEKYTPAFVVTAKTEDGETAILAVHLSREGADTNANAINTADGFMNLVRDSVRVYELALSK